MPWETKGFVRRAYLWPGADLEVHPRSVPRALGWAKSRLGLTNAAVTSCGPFPEGEALASGKPAGRF